ncbi:MAG: FtsX-like permease family protein [Chloroflexi bacterium]|nr:FtsX-like permease family protein [Chloroflexota bacterium]
MFSRVLVRSIRNRPTRIAVAVVAVLLGAILVSALTSVSLDARGKAGKELRSYGANVLLLPRSESLQVGAGALDFGFVEDLSFIAEADLASLQSPEIASNLAGYAPYIYGIVDVAQQKVILGGTNFAQVSKISPWWQITGKWPEEADQAEPPSPAIVGSEVARKLGLDVGSAFDVAYGARSQSLQVTGIVDTGAAEDSQIFVGLPVAQELLGKRALVSVVQVSALTQNQSAATTSAQIENKMPGARAKVIGQIAEAEMSVLGKVELLLAIVAVLVLLASGLTVASTMTTTVLERTKEIGLLKALGASETRIALLFVAEATTIGALGGILGYLVGFLVAQVIGQMVFGSAVAPNVIVLPLSIIVALGVAVLASALPVRRAVRIDPAITLRGE